MNRSDAKPTECRAEFQILTTRFTVAAVGSKAVATLRFLPSGIVYDLPPRRQRNIAMTHREVQYEIAIDDGPPREEGDAALAMQWLHEVSTKSALEDHGQGVALSAGSAVVDGRRILFAGGDRLTRTCLAMRLLLDGHDVESDRYSLIDGDGGTGLALRLPLVETALAEIPELKSVPPSVPSVVDERDFRVYLFSPTDFGLESRVTRGPVDAIFLLDVNRGGDTRIASARRLDVLEALVPDGVAWRPPEGDWIGPLTAAVGQAKTYRLFYGDVAAAERLIEEKLAAL